MGGGIELSLQKFRLEILGLYFLLDDMPENGRVDGLGEAGDLSVGMLAGRHPTALLPVLVLTDQGCVLLNLLIFHAIQFCIILANTSLLSQ